jgi:hypothetical protein
LGGSDWKHRSRTRARRTGWHAVSKSRAGSAFTRVAVEHESGAIAGCSSREPCSSTCSSWCSSLSRLLCMCVPVFQSFLRVRTEWNALHSSLLWGSLPKPWITLEHWNTNPNPLLSGLPPWASHSGTITTRVSDHSFLPAPVFGPLETHVRRFRWFATGLAVR